MKNKNNSKVLIIVLCLAIIAAIIPFFMLNSGGNKPVKSETLFYDYNISSTPGFILDNDAMHFGVLPPNGKSTRPMNITTSEKYLIKIHYKGDGYLVVDENDFILDENQTKTLNFTITPINNSIGYYSGNIIFDFYETE